jgi:TolA-binding protein
VKASLIASEELNRELGKTNQALDSQVRALKWEVADMNKAMQVQTSGMNEALEKRKLEAENMRVDGENRENALILHVNNLESQILELNSQVESFKHLCEDKIEERRMIVELLEKERIDTLENEDKLAGQIKDASKHIERVKDENSSQVCLLSYKLGS